MFTRKLLFIGIFINQVLFADAPTSAIHKTEDLSKIDSRYEMAPLLRKVDILQNSDVLRVIVRASGPSSCYTEREIERYIEKDLVKIVLRLKRPVSAVNELKSCPQNHFEYEEKVYETAVAQAPKEIWILGYEGWNKFKVSIDEVKPL